MHKEIITLPSIKLVGITARTNNAHEVDPLKSRISPTFQKYVQEQVPEKITHRIKPGTTYSVFTDYESGATGDYTYFLGEEVSMFDLSSKEQEELNVPKQTYVRFTTDQGPMPQVCIEAWKEIWKMEPAVLGGKRRYLCDFEIYDHRALDPKNTVFDIYIGIDPHLD